MRLFQMNSIAMAIDMSISPTVEQNDSN